MEKNLISRKVDLKWYTVILEACIVKSRDLSQGGMRRVQSWAEMSMMHNQGEMNLVKCSP